MKSPEPQQPPYTPSQHDRSKCEVCGKEAEFQFLDKSSGELAIRWRKLCRDHAREFLDNMPDTGSGILE